MFRLRPQPLSKDSFGSFGDVAEAAGSERITINAGFAQRCNNLAHVDVAGEGGTTNFSLFVAQPRPRPIRIDMMERHPLASQLFFPLQDEPWLVVVCGDPQVPESYRAFIASGQQGVNYARSVWHYPLLVHAADSRFIVVDRKGPGTNLEEATLPATLQIVVDFPYPA